MYKDYGNKYPTDLDCFFPDTTLVGQIDERRKKNHDKFKTAEIFRQEFLMFINMQIETELRNMSHRILGELKSTVQDQDNTMFKKVWCRIDDLENKQYQYYHNILELLKPNKPKPSKKK